jgi:hypothetical protein
MVAWLGDLIMPKMESYSNVIHVNFIGQDSEHGYDTYELETFESELVLVNGFINTITRDTNEDSFTVTFYI